MGLALLALRCMQPYPSRLARFCRVALFRAIAMALGLRLFLGEETLAITNILQVGGVVLALLWPDAQQYQALGTLVHLSLPRQVGSLYCPCHGG